MIGKPHHPRSILVIDTDRPALISAVLNWNRNLVNYRPTYTNLRPPGSVTRFAGACRPGVWDSGSILEGCRPSIRKTCRYLVNCSQPVADADAPPSHPPINERVAAIAMILRLRRSYRYLFTKFTRGSLSRRFNEHTQSQVTICTTLRKIARINDDRAVWRGPGQEKIVRPTQSTGGGFPADDIGPIWM